MADGELLVVFEEELLLVPPADELDDVRLYVLYPFHSSNALVCSAALVGRGDLQ
jgi:hypothetical protein